MQDRDGGGNIPKFHKQHRRLLFYGGNMKIRNNLNTFMFYEEDAIKYGIDIAVMLYHLKFWIKHNIANGTNYKEGYYWTYNSYSAFKKLFPFWSEAQIGRIIRKMEEQNIIKSMNNNKKGFDKTKWYCITDKQWIDDCLKSYDDDTKSYDDDTKSYDDDTKSYDQYQIINNTDNKHTDNKHTDNILHTADLKKTKSAEIKEKNIPDIKNNSIDNNSNIDCKHGNTEILSENNVNSINNPKKEKELKKLNSNNSTRFIKPTIEEIEIYCSDEGINIDANQFYYFYESKGWMIGKNKMKNWKAAVRTWERNRYNNNAKLSDAEEFLRLGKEI